jgi:hypothetical protein
MRRLAILLIAFALAGVTTADMLDGPTPGPVVPAGSDVTPSPGLLDGGILRDGAMPSDGPSPPLDGRATPS